MVLPLGKWINRLVVLERKDAQIRALEIAREGDRLFWFSVGFGVAMAIVAFALRLGWVL